MSLSQKHKGLVLVPWFNSAEWKTVNDFVYSEDQVLHRKALEILHVWKIRTPNLPVGVEGTRILLEAFLINSDVLTEEQIVSAYALSLLRFLNICAASSERQGTFTKSAKDNNWPEWIVNIRHDIAHGGELPSLDMLKMCLEYCWEWVKENYWKQQYGNLNDYIVLEKNNEKKSYKVLYCYIMVNFNVYIGNYYEDLDGSLKSTLYSILPKKLRNLKPSLHVLLNFLQDLLYEEQTCEDFKSSVEEVMDVLIDPHLLLYVCSELTENESRSIPAKFRNIWVDLLKVLLNQNLLFILINSLLTVTANSVHIPDTRETAAAWILEIFRGLVKTKFIKEKLKLQEQEASSAEEWCTIDEIVEKSRPDLVEAIDFGNPSTLPYKDAEIFLNRTLKTPTEYTLIYLDSVFEFCGSPKKAADEARESIKSLFLVSSTQSNSEVKTIEDLDIEIIEEDSSEAQHAKNNGHTHDDNYAPQPQSRWRRIDAKQFEGCPLGVLPHQDRTNNPLLRI